MFFRNLLVLGLLLFSGLQMNAFANDYEREEKFRIRIDLPRIPLPRIPIKVNISICSREFSVNIIAAEACRVSLSALSVCGSGATPACYTAIAASASLCNIATEDIRRACLE